MGRSMTSGEKLVGPVSANENLLFIKFELIILHSVTDTETNMY